MTNKQKSKEKTTIKDFLKIKRINKTIDQNLVESEKLEEEVNVFVKLYNNLLYYSSNLIVYGLYLDIKIGKKTSKFFRIYLLQI